MVGKDEFQARAPDRFLFLIELTLIAGASFELNEIGNSSTVGKLVAGFES